MIDLPQQKPKHYLDAGEMFDETLVCLRKEEISDKLGKMFYQLAEKFVNHPNFVRYHHIREDLISYAVLGCIKGFSRFMPYRNILERDEHGEIISSTKQEWNGEHVEYNYLTCNNPFAYYTTTANNEILQFLKSEYKQKNISNKMKLSMGIDADEGYRDMIREQEAEKALNEPDVYEDENSNVDENGIEWEKL